MQVDLERKMCLSGMSLWKPVFVSLVVECLELVSVFGGDYELLMEGSVIL